MNEIEKRIHDWLLFSQEVPNVLSGVIKQIKSSKETYLKTAYQKQAKGLLKVFDSLLRAKDKKSLSKEDINKLDQSLNLVLPLWKLVLKEKIEVSERLKKELEKRTRESN